MKQNSEQPTCNMVAKPLRPNAIRNLAHSYCRELQMALPESISIGTCNLMDMSFLIFIALCRNSIDKLKPVNTYCV